MKKEDLQTSEMQQAFVLAQPFQTKYKKYVRTFFKEYEEVVPKPLHSNFLDCFDGMESCQIAKDFNDVLNTTEAFFLKDDKPIIDLSKNKIYDLPYPKGVNKKMYFLIANKVMNVTMKGVGKGEVLLNFVFGNAVKKTDKHKDNVVLDLDGRQKVIECKNKNASYKANRKSNFRIIDELLDSLYGGISGEQFRCDDIGAITTYVTRLYPDMALKDRQDIIKFWQDSKDRSIDKETSRRVYITSKIMKEYQTIDNHDVVIHSSQSTQKQKMQFAVIADSSDLEFIKENFDCRPQLKRGGGTQAVGDGYCDVKLKLS